MPKEFDPRVTAYVRANLPSVLQITQTVRQQAKMVGVSDAQLSEVLNGKATVGKATLPLFAKALGMTTEELVATARSADVSVGVGAASEPKSPPVDSDRERVLDQAAEILIREGFEMRRAEHAAKWVGREPERRGGYTPLTAERVAALARALLRAEDALQTRRSSTPPSSDGPTGPSTRHKIRRAGASK